MFEFPDFPSGVLDGAVTIGAVLKRHGITLTRRRKRMEIPYPAPLRTALAPNDIWCADFKGEFRVGTGQLCYPLTITDRFSRYILRCEGLEGTHTEPAKDVFVAVNTGVRKENEDKITEITSKATPAMLFRKIGLIARVKSTPVTFSSALIKSAWRGFVFSL